MQIKIGAHISIASGYAKAAQDCIDIGADTFQFFTRNPRGGNAKPLNDNDVMELTKTLKDNNFAPILAHCPYTVNMASGKEETSAAAQELLKADFEVMEKLGATLYNVHPGSHVGIGVEAGIDNIVRVINNTLNENSSFFFLLETMSGKGSEIGRNFEELKQIIDRVNYPEKIGVCMDTCHVFCAGYDIVNDLDKVFTDFDCIVGLNKLMAVHLNDSMNPFASNKDRHAITGEGYIGFDAIVNFISHPAVNSLPMFLETPNKDLNGYKIEIERLRNALAAR